MLIQKFLIAFRFLSLLRCDWLCAWPRCHLGSLFCCLVVGSASSVALLTGWHEVLERVVATAVNLNEMISFGGLPAFAPVAPGFVGQDGTPVFVVLACLTWASVLRWHGVLLPRFAWPSALAALGCSQRTSSNLTVCQATRFVFGMSLVCIAYVLPCQGRIPPGDHPTVS
jgi:hypothetical protein